MKKKRIVTENIVGVSVTGDNWKEVALGLKLMVEGYSLEGLLSICKAMRLKKPAIKDSAKLNRVDLRLQVAEETIDINLWS